jgi:ribonuclease HII
MTKKFDRSLIPAAPDLSFEVVLWAAGVQIIGGVDEAGRGALAGPVSAAVLVLPVDSRLVHALHGVRDSKQMSPKARQYWSGRLKAIALSWGVGFASPGEIDELGIVPATRLAVGRALQACDPMPQHLLVDYLDLPDCSLPQTRLVKGDARSLSIASASILAKTARDDLMSGLDEKYPGYGLALHKGYGTVAHRQAIANLGHSPIHRASFRTSPVSRKYRQQ